MQISHQMSAQSKRKVQAARWQRLLDFLASGNASLNATQKKNKLRLARERMTIEMDIARLIQTLSTSADFRRIDVSALADSLNGVYGINRKMVNFGQNFPSELTFFKLVAVVGNRYFSIFDGVTEYKVGVTMRQELSDLTWAKSGFFVHSSVEDAVQCKFPRDSRLLRAPRAMLRVSTPGDAKMRVWGSQGKIALSDMTPISVHIKFGRTPKSTSFVSSISSATNKKACLPVCCSSTTTVTSANGKTSSSGCQTDSKHSNGSAATLLLDCGADTCGGCCCCSEAQPCRGIGCLAKPGVPRNKRALPGSGEINVGGSWVKPWK
jgi:hypothetical protein